MVHIACLNNQPKICHLLFSHIKSLNVDESKIRAWLNSRTDEGFTPIHFASFKGNIVKTHFGECNSYLLNRNWLNSWNHMVLILQLRITKVSKIFKEWFLILFRFECRSYCRSRRSTSFFGMNHPLINGFKNVSRHISEKKLSQSMKEMTKEVHHYIGQLFLGIFWEELFF